MSDLDESQSQRADPPSPWPPEVAALGGLARSGRCHLKDPLCRGNRLSSLSMALGIPLVVLTTLVGTSVFATLQETLNTRMRIFAGLAIVLAAVLASLQSFLSSAERAEKNWAAGEMWAAIRREITEVLALHPANLATRDDPRQYLDELRARMDEVAKESPVMSSHLFCTHLQARWASINLWTAHGPPNSNFAASFSHTRRNWKEITDGHR